MAPMEFHETGVAVCSTSSLLGDEVSPTRAGACRASGTSTFPSGGLDWTLGDGVRSLREEYGADYALFVGFDDSYQSAGAVGSVLITTITLGVVAPPPGRQMGAASLVDLWAISCGRAASTARAGATSGSSRRHGRRSAEETGAGRERPSGLLAAYPPTAERVAMARAWVARMEWAAGPAVEIRPDAHRAVMAPLLSGLPWMWGVPPAARISRIHRTIGRGSSSATYVGPGNLRPAAKAARRSARPLQRYAAGRETAAGSSCENQRTGHIPAAQNWSVVTMGDEPGTAQSAWRQGTPPCAASAR